MALIDENQVAENVKWYNITNTPLEFSKVAVYGDEIYLPITALNLTNANVVSYMLETNSGEALITKTGKMFLSGQTILDMAAIAHPDKVNELEECLALLFEKAMESELIQYPVNVKPL